MSNPQDLNEMLSTLYHALRTTRRRHVIQCLNKVDSEALTTRELAKKIASHEQDIAEPKATGEPYRNVYNALSQTHLPTLSDAGIIIYDPERQRVKPDDSFELAMLLIDVNALAVWGFSVWNAHHSRSDQRRPQSLIE